jgi:hypothetical protein
VLRDIPSQYGKNGEEVQTRIKRSPYVEIPRVAEGATLRMTFDCYFVWMRKKAAATKAGASLQLW